MKLSKLVNFRSITLAIGIIAGGTAPAAVVATNSGGLGPTADGAHGAGTTLERVGAMVGNANRAASYDGANAGTLVPFIAGLNPQAPFTVELWVKPDTIPNSAGTPCPVSSAQFSGDRSGWQIRERDTGYQFVLYNHVGGDTAANVLGGGVPSTNAWTHLVGVYDGATAYLYVNGALANSSSAAGFTANYNDGVNSPGPLTIGYRSSLDNYFDGLVDEVAIYTNALPALAIAAHYENGTNEFPSSSYDSLVIADGAVAYYRLNEKQPAAHRDYILGLNPLAYYRLNEAAGTAANSGTLGAAADGAYTGGTLTAEVAGPRPAAFAGFESNNAAITVNGGYVDINNPSGLNISGQFTFQAWVKIPATSALDTPGHIGNIVAHGYSTSDFMETVLRVRNNGGIRVYNIGTYNSVNWSDAGASFAVPTNDIGGDWVYLAGTYDGTQFNLYHNGVQVANAADPLNQGAWATSTGEWGIGARANGPDRFFDGSVDEVGVFDYALTEAQVWAAYTNATGVTGLAPFITAQPRGDTNLYVGESHTLSVSASGMPAPSYQWRKNGTNLVGVTSSSYTISPAAVADSGDYDVVVANLIGSVTSSVAPVTVYDVSTLTNSTGYKDFILTLSPLAYYRLDEDASGLVAANIGTLGVAVNGLYSGSVTSLVKSFRPPSYPGLETNNKAVTFSANGYVNIPNDTSMNFTGAVTLAAWVKLPATAAWSTGNILAHGYGSEVNETVLRLNGNAYEVGNYRGTCCWSGVTAGSTIPAGDFGGGWVFLVGTWDGAQWNLYRNGELVATASDAYGAVQTDGTWGVGARSVGPDRFVGDGVSVDEVAIFNYSLTPAQVLEAYNIAIGIPCSAPTISGQPAGNTNLYVGESHTLSVGAAASPAPTYQWRKDGSNLGDATNSSYTLNPAAVADTGNYDVVVANGCGSLTSSVATVTVYDPALLTSSTAYQEFILGLEPLGYYRLNTGSGTEINLGTLGSAADGTYNGPVTLVNGLRPPGTGFETGNKAVKFSATGAISMGNPAGMNISNQITLAAWIKLPASAPWSGDANIIAHGYSTVDFRETVLRFSGNNYQVGTYNDVDWTDHKASYAIPSGDFGGDWISLVGTFDGAQWKLYRNGVLVATANDTYGAWPTDNGVWGIGANTTLNNRYLGAVTVDEVAIFDYALTASQVQAQYALALFGLPQISINRSGSDAVITWSVGMLQEADDVAGPYTNVPGATSPYTVPPGPAKKFYRVGL